MATLDIWRDSRVLRLGLASVFGLILLFGLLLAMGAARSPEVALAQGSTIRYVAPAPTGDDDSNDCITSTVPCATVQHAVDEADPGDEILVATGVYTGVQARAGITQVVYISKTVTVRGGYTTTDWSTSNPASYPTTLDAQEQGRVLYVTGDVSVTIEGLHITGGNAAGLGGGPWTSSGGGALVVGATVTMSNNQVFSNSAAFGGGLFFRNSANAILASNTITGNTGWIHAGGLYFWDSPGATLVANTISGNKAGGPGSNHYGGGRFVNSGNATLIGNTVSRNAAENTCGGLCFHNSDGIVLESNTITGNHAGAQGGGLYLYNSDVTMTNTIIADNRANGVGGGLHIERSSPRLLHTTIARNTSGDGSGVYIFDTSAVVLTNTILVSHTVGITVTTGSTAALDGVLWHSNTINYGGGGAIAVTNAYTGNPAFAADGYHLTSASAAINKGVDAGVGDDIDGDLRPQGGGYDLGADEFVCRVYLPLVLKSSG